MRQIDAILSIIVVLVVLGVAFALYRGHQTIQDLKTDVEQADRTAGATTGIVSDAGAAQEVIHRTEVIVRDTRADYQRSYEDAKRDPTVAEFAATPIPPRLRELARARREARERSGGDGDGSRDHAAAPGTSR